MDINKILKEWPERELQTCRFYPCDREQRTGYPHTCRFHQLRIDEGQHPIYPEILDKTIQKSGYILVRTAKGQWVGEHRLVMEMLLGRPLLSTETVHHKDSNRGNNSIENLELWSGTHTTGYRLIDACKNSILNDSEFFGEIVRFLEELRIGQNS